MKSKLVALRSQVDIKEIQRRNFARFGLSIPGEEPEPTVLAPSPVEPDPRPISLAVRPLPAAPGYLQALQIPQRPADLMQLPDDILLKTLMEMPLSDILKLRQVNRRFRWLINSEFVHHYLVVRHNHTRIQNPGLFFRQLTTQQGFFAQTVLHMDQPSRNDYLIALDYFKRHKRIEGCLLLFNKARRRHDLADFRLYLEFLDAFRGFAEKHDPDRNPAFDAAVNESCARAMAVPNRMQSIQQATVKELKRFLDILLRFNGKVEFNGQNMCFEHTYSKRYLELFGGVQMDAVKGVGLSLPGVIFSVLTLARPIPDLALDYCQSCVHVASILLQHNPSPKDHKKAVKLFNLSNSNSRGQFKLEDTCYLEVR